MDRLAAAKSFSGAAETLVDMGTLFGEGGFRIPHTTAPACRAAVRTKAGAGTAINFFPGEPPLWVRKGSKEFAPLRSISTRRR